MDNHGVKLLYLIGGFSWNMTGLCFPYDLGIVIIPIDELIFFRGVGIPPTISIDYPQIIHRLSIDYQYTNHILTSVGLLE